MVYARLGNPPLPSLGEEAANAPSNCKCEKRFACGVYILLCEKLISIKIMIFDACVDDDAKIENIEVDRRFPPVYRCVSILGVCGVTLSEDRCIQLCNDYYSGVNPYARCGLFLELLMFFVIANTIVGDRS